MLNHASAPAVDRDLLEAIRSRLPDFSPAERRVADAVLATPHDVPHMSAARLAEHSDSSVGSVVRFCHTLGLPGYQDFKLRAARLDRPAVRYKAPDAISGADAPRDVVQKTLANMSDVLAKLSAAIDTGSIVRAADTLIGAQRILIVAAGPSIPFATDLAHWLIYNGLAATFPVDSETQQAVARGLGPNDVCFAISNSGTTRRTLESVHSAARRGASTVALTSFANSELATSAETVLIAGDRADRYRSADMASRFVHFTALHTLCVAIAHQQQSSRPRLDH